MISYFKNERGMSLIELLATVALAGIVAALIFSVMSTSLRTTERISAESELRDEADLIMSNFIESLYKTKQSEISRHVTAASSSYILLKNNQKIGFDRQDVLVTRPNTNHLDQTIQENLKPINQKITIASPSTIEEVANGQYEIKLFLKHEDFKEAIETRSRIGIIRDKSN